jgi:hypothetical protein
MAASQSASQDLPAPIQGYVASTFLERGVAVPFTTPLLAGARARPGDRTSIDLIVPNPSGGRGVYILAWEGIAALCRPTVHDSRLCSAVATLHGVTPATIRATARDLAEQGFAGREAQAGARAAREAEQQSRLLTNFDLLLALVKQIETPTENAVAPERAGPGELEKRARRAVARIAPELGRTPESVANSLEQLANLYGPIGIGRHASTAKMPLLLANLVAMRREMTEHLAAYPEENGNEAELVGSVTDLTVACGKATLADAYAMAGDVVALLRRWGNDPEEVGRILARPEWLLDGWDRIHAMWATAEQHRGRSTTLLEMATLVPTVPREAGDWVGQRINLEAELLRHKRKVTLLEDWRSGVTLTDLIGRNEALLALTS